MAKNNSKHGSYLEMIKLSEEYKKSIELLTVRIKELNGSYKLLCSASSDPLKDFGCIETKRRLDVLIRWRTELKELAHEIKEYYNPAHWRSGDYTMNMKLPQVYRWVPYTDDVD